MLDLARRLVRGPPHELISYADAREEYAAFRGQHGAKAVATPLLTHPNDNAKFAKTTSPIYGLSLANADGAGVNVCRFSTNECRRGCVSYAGKGELASVQAGRVRKTQFLAEHTPAFLTLLTRELEAVWKKHGNECRVRLNTFSDIPWEDVRIVGIESVFSAFPRMRFFDYTKWYPRAVDANLGWYGWPGNYRLIMSASENTDDETIVGSVNEGLNYAVVFDVKRGRSLPALWQGVQVVDGDLGDDRWSDPKGIVVGLRAKGRMRSGVWDMKREAV